MTTEKIIENVLTLSDADRQRVIDAILADRKGRRAQQALQVAQLYGGIVDGLHTGRRWARCMISWQMRLDGFVQREIAPALGVDKSCISYDWSNFAVVTSRPHLFPDECAAWEKFNQKLNDYVSKRNS